MSQQAEKVVGAYGAAWLEPDETERLKLLHVAWSDTGTYHDPTAELFGRDALNAHIGNFQQQLPGAKIVITSHVDEHHGKLRFTWKMVAADGTTTVEGVDFADLSDDGRLASIVGFFGPATPLS